MPRERILPSDSVLERYLDEGMTHKEIAEKVSKETGHKVSRSTVSVAISRAGLSDRVRYDDVIPWERIKVEHNTEYPLQMLRLLARTERGLPVSVDQRERLERWMERLDEENAVVHYEPRSEQGFWYVPREKGDKGYIRTPKARPRQGN